VLRIVSINDVYALENLPRFATLVAHHRQADPMTPLLVILAGDFLAPSLLSSIDAGRGMVDCLNACGVTHVVLGNHEDDLPRGELWARLKELGAKCIATNVHPRSELGLLPRHDVVQTPDGLDVGIVGVVMTAPTVYRGKPFGEADLLPANDTAIEAAAALVAGGCAGVIAMTHQTEDEDRDLAHRSKDARFLAIIGGHEHVPLLTQVDGTWIVKAGTDAEHAAITEVTWPDPSRPSEWTTTTRLEDVASYAEDPAVRTKVEGHLARVRELGSATLLHVRPGEALSSIGTRSKQTTLGSLICSKLRDSLGADACLFNGGGIRASREYAERFTYGDVEAEIPFDNEVVVVPLTGHVILEAVAASRSHAPTPSGSFLQVDDRMTVTDDAKHQVLRIAGADLDPGRTYRVALIRELLLGLDRIEPLARWGAEHPELLPPPGSGREPKLVLVQAFAIAIWRELGGFDAIDTNKDGQVTPSEVEEAVARAHPSVYPGSHLLADLVVRAVDTDADHIISRSDVAAIERDPEEV
jgi:2',3'-cyclic-nucleotide 2'-phosphodiesterase (5'-nucleotidase family)